MDWPGSRAGPHEAQLPFVQHIDGRGSIREIIECVLAQHGLADAGTTALESFVRELFEALWHVDLVAMALPAGAQDGSAA